MNAAELKKRRRYLGGSEVAAVLGLSPFQTAAGLYDEKMGLVEPKETSDAMLVGIHLEDGIAKLWAAQRRKKTGVDFRMLRNKPLCHPEHKFMRASPDRILWEVGATVPLEGLEIKCISKFSEAAGGWGRSGSKDYPEYYKVQCAWNRMIFDLPRWNLVAMVADGRYTLKSYVYEADLAYEANLRSMALDFWQNHILKKVRPEEKPVHRLTSPDSSDILSKLPAIAPAWMTEETSTPNATV